MVGGWLLYSVVGTTAPKRHANLGARHYGVAIGDWQLLVQLGKVRPGSDSE